MSVYLSKQEIMEDYASIADSLVGALECPQKPLLMMLPGGE